MTLPYSGTTTGKSALLHIEKILRAFGCSKFASGEDFETGEVFIQFEHHDRPVMFKASAKGYAAAWLRENPWTHRKRMTKEKWHQRAMQIGSVAVYSILRDAVKGQIAAIECGIWTFEETFLSHVMLPNGKRVIDQVYEGKLLPALDLQKEEE